MKGLRSARRPPQARANGRFEEIAVYITMFPQLVAGPIVRYSTIAHRRAANMISSPRG